MEPSLNLDIIEWAGKEYGTATALTIAKILAYWEHMDKVDFTFIRLRMNAPRLRQLAESIHTITGD